MNEITIDEKIYISAKRAAEITGYARDYIGQLCREGNVDAKMVGRSWYVYEPSVRMHRFGVATIPVPESYEEVAEPQKEEIPAESSKENSISGWERPKYTVEETKELTEMTPMPYEELLPPVEDTLTDMQEVWREWFDRQQQQKHHEIKDSSEVFDENSPEEAENELETQPEIEVEEHDEEQEHEHLAEVLDEEENEEEEDTSDEMAEATVPFTKIHTEDDVAPVEELARVVEEGSEPIEIKPIIKRISHPPIQAPSYSNRINPSTSAQTNERYGRIVEERVITRPRGSLIGSSKVTYKKGIQRKAKRSGYKVAYAPVAALFIAVSALAIAVATIGTGVGNKYSASVINSSNPVVQFLVGTRNFNR